MRDLLLSHTSIVILPTTRNPQIKGRILKSTTNLRSLIQSVPVKMRPSFRCENAHLPFIPAPFSDPPHLTPPHVHSALPTSMQFPWSIQWSRWSRRQRIGDVVIHSLVDSSMSRYCPLLCTIMLMDIGWIWKYGWMDGDFTPISQLYFTRFNQMKMCVCVFFWRLSCCFFHDLKSSNIAKQEYVIPKIRVANQTIGFCLIFQTINVIKPWEIWSNYGL